MKIKETTKQVSLMMPASIVEYYERLAIEEIEDCGLTPNSTTIAKGRNDIMINILRHERESNDLKFIRE